MLVPLEDVAEEIATGHFINGPKESIKAEVGVLSVTNLDQAMDLALKLEYMLQQGEAQTLTRQPKTFSIFNSQLNKAHPQNSITQPNLIAPQKTRAELPITRPTPTTPQKAQLEAPFNPQDLITLPLNPPTLIP